MSAPRTRHVASLVLAVAAAALVVTGGVQVLRDSAGAGEDRASQPSASATASASASASRSPGISVRTSAEPPREVRAPSRPGAPRRISVPAIGVDAVVVPVEAPGGTLIPPADASRLGWWAPGAPAGSRRGATLVAGHTVHTGGGALDDLDEVRRGDRVVVRTADRRVTYRVTSVRVLTKGAVNRNAERLFAQDGPGRLVLVTCEGWNGTGYDSNVVVTASPVRQSSPTQRS